MRFTVQYAFMATINIESEIKRQIINYGLKCYSQNETLLNILLTSIVYYMLHIGNSFYAKPDVLLLFVPLHIQSSHMIYKQN